MYLNTRELACNGGDGAVGGGDQHDVGGECAGIEARLRAARADGADGGAGRLRLARDDGADAPAAPAQKAAEGAADTAGADDSERGTIRRHGLSGERVYLKPLQSALCRQAGW